MYSFVNLTVQSLSKSLWNQAECQKKKIFSNSDTHNFIYLPVKFLELLSCIMNCSRQNKAPVHVYFKICHGGIENNNKKMSLL